MEVTAKIARFVAESRYEAMPARAIETAKTALLDYLGVALAGSREACARICAQIAREEAGREEATVIGQGFKSSVRCAAFANGTAAHALDYDHSFILMGQPTAPIIPAIFSLAESLGASGRQFLEAYIVGFEVAAKMVLSLRAAAQDGWHAPGTLGSFGASAACAKLMRLSAPEVEMALGITASLAGGVVCNFGTMTKPLHVGLAARNGVLAAKLAASGYTANARGIEAELGFYEMFHRATPPDNGPIEALGQSYELETNGIRIKPYPCGGLTHPAIDAVLELRASHGITAEMVESIEVGVAEHTYNRIVFRIPQTGLQGKFSMSYLLARAIVDGKISLNAFTDEAVRDRNVLRLAERIHMKLDPALKTDHPAGRPCKVAVRLRGGQIHSRQVEHAKGSREVPLSAAELRQKFFECARRAISEESAQQAMEGIERLENLADMRPLCGLVMG